MSIILWFIWNGFFVFYLLNILRNLPNVKGTWGRPSPSVPQSVCFLFAFSFFAWPSGFSFFLSLSPLLFFLNLTCLLFSSACFLFFFPKVLHFRMAVKNLLAFVMCPDHFNLTVVMLSSNSPTFCLKFSHSEEGQKG